MMMMMINVWYQTYKMSSELDSLWQNSTGPLDPWTESWLEKKN
jgi:hypothetical protein